MNPTELKNIEVQRRKTIIEEQNFKFKYFLEIKNELIQQYKHNLGMQQAKQTLKKRLIRRYITLRYTISAVTHAWSNYQKVIQINSDKRKAAAASLKLYMYFKRALMKKGNPH